MTVQELIDELMEIKDKTKSIYISYSDPSFNYGCGRKNGREIHVVEDQKSLGLQVY